jgi:hypothetical protein
LHAFAQSPGWWLLSRGEEQTASGATTGTLKECNVTPPVARNFGTAENRGMSKEPLHNPDNLGPLVTKLLALAAEEEVILNDLEKAVASGDREATFACALRLVGRGKSAEKPAGKARNCKSGNR